MRVKFYRPPGYVGWCLFSIGESARLNYEVLPDGRIWGFHHTDWIDEIYRIPTLRALLINGELYDRASAFSRLKQ